MSSSLLLGVGLVSWDLAVELSDLPPNGRVHAKRAITVGGGMAANTLAALAALGWTAEMAGVVGSDAAGKAAIKSLRKGRVGTRWIQRRKGAVTPQAICIAQSAQGQRTIIGLPERGCELRIRDLPRILTTSHPPAPISRVLHTDGWHGPASLAAMKSARRRGWLTSYNGGWITPYSQRLARLADVAVVSKDFAGELAPHADPPDLLRAVCRWIKAAKQEPVASAARPAHQNTERWLVLTAGTEGAWGCRLSAARPTEFIHQPAFPVKVADSTGAGDAFHAGLLHGRLKGWSLEESLRWAAAAGALACTELGARASQLTPARILRLLG